MTPTVEHERRSGSRSRWTVALLSALATATSLSVVGSSRPSGADQISSLRAQAASLAHQLVLQQLKVDADQQQYSVASAQVAADDRAIAGLDQQIAATKTSVAARTNALRTQAVRSYVDEGTQSTMTEILTGSADRVQAAVEYQSIAVGNITTQIDQLRSAQKTLQSQRSALASREAADRAGRAQQAAALSQADGAARQLAGDQAQVSGQLVSAVAAAQVTQRAAAAVAVSAAQQAATRGTPVAANSGGGGGPGAGAPIAAPAAPPGGGADPALPPFLQCVVQAESGGNYGAVSPDGQYMGAFQFSQSTWNLAAQAAGRPDLVGVPPNLASKPDQDTLAVTLFSLDGEQPWLGDRCSA